MAKLTLEQLFTLLTSNLTIPVRYKREKLQTFDTAETDYIVYHVISEPNKLDGSNKTIWKTANIQLNLITKIKNQVLETQLETLLTANKIQFIVSSESYDDDARLIIRIYEFELDKFY